MALANHTCLALILASIIGVTYAAVFPEFLPIPSTMPADKIVPSASYYAPNRPDDLPWYANWPTNLRMWVFGRKTFKLDMHCNVKPLDKKDELSRMEFCFDGSCTVQTEPITNKMVKLSSKPDSGLAIISFDRQKGGMAKIEETVSSKLVSTKFYCKAVNKMGSVTSNELEIIDLRRRAPGSQWQSAEVVDNLAKNAPRTFQCLQKNDPPAAGQPPYKVEWAYCLQIGPIPPDRCSPSFFTGIVDVKKWPYQIKPNGDLFVPFFTDSAVAALSGHQLICRLNQQRVNVYKNALKFKSTVNPADAATVLKITQPLSSQPVKVLNSPTTRVFYPCNFELGPGEVTVSWKYKSNDGKVVKDLKVTGARDENGVKIEAPVHGMRLVGPFTDNTPGEYSCIVKWTPASRAPVQMKTASYKVSVDYFPSASDKMVPLKYVVSDNNGTVDCIFKDPFPKTSPPGMKVIPSVAINGEPIDLTSSHTAADSVKSINSKFNTVMAGLKVVISPYSPKAGDSLSFTALKMQYEDPLTKKSSSHLVQCIGKNDIGSVRANTLLKVVPLPKLAKSPSNFNCTKCSAKEDHIIYCSVSNVKEITDSGAVFKQFWQLGDKLVDDLIAPKDAPARKFLFVSPDRTSLTIKKIDDKDFRNQVNALGEIHCVLTMGYPAGAKVPEEIAKKTGVEKGLFYISLRSDKKKELTTPIMLTNIAPPPPTKMGGMMWLVPVILALIIILIIIAATYYYCRRRQGGEEYNVDAKEKQQGNDPETEVAEKEAFPVYERPEDGPIRGSRASLDDSIHVGSDDEDEVLAEYDVDIGKFDEEGSFIGQYANDGTQPGNRRLPNVGNNTEV